MAENQIRPDPITRLPGEPTYHDDLIQMAKLEPVDAGLDEALDGLTEREGEVLTLIAEGLTNQEIASKLFISIKTVQTHRAHIMEKLNLHDRTELVRYAIRKGLIQP